jgi:hypothetical protein
MAGASNGDSRCHRATHLFLTFSLSRLAKVNTGQIDIDPFSGPSVEQLPRGGALTAITWSRSSEAPRVRCWPLTASALRHPARFGCIGRSALRSMLTRIGVSDRSEFEAWLRRRGLSNRRELGVIDRKSLKSTSKPLACLNRVQIVSPRRASPAGLTRMNVASVCPSGFNTIPTECLRMMSQICSICILCSPMRVRVDPNSPQSMQPPRVGHAN